MGQVNVHTAWAYAWWLTAINSKQRGGTGNRCSVNESMNALSTYGHQRSTAALWNFTVCQKRAPILGTLYYFSRSSSLHPWARLNPWTKCRVDCAEPRSNLKSKYVVTMTSTWQTYISALNLSRTQISLSWIVCSTFVASPLGARTICLHWFWHVMEVIPLE